MKSLKLAFAAACAFAATAASAGVAEAKGSPAASGVNTCYYQYSILTPDAIYDVYYCYGNGDGSY